MPTPPHPLIHRFFNAYCKFFNSDLESAIIAKRNFAIINVFRVALATLLSGSIKNNNKLLNTINALENVIDIERELYSEINIYKCIGGYRNTIKEIFDEIDKCVVHFLDAYEFLYEVYNEDEEDRKFQDILVEFNNALSHIMTALQNQEDDTIKIPNISKAKTHLYRGSLDSYKEVIIKNKSIVMANTQKITRLGNKTFKEYYIDLRKYEASHIGRTEKQNEEIINRYRKLAWSLVN